MILVCIYVGRGGEWSLPSSIDLFQISRWWWCLVAKLCLTLCNPKDCSLPGFSVHGISQARILEWVAISFSRGSSQPRDWTHVSCIGRRILYQLNHQGSPKYQGTWFMFWISPPSNWDSSLLFASPCPSFAGGWADDLRSVLPTKSDLLS